MFDLKALRIGLERDPVLSCPSRFVEVFPELGRHYGAQDLSSVRLINADFIAKASFYFDGM
jgi:hypothetical protein